MRRLLPLVVPFVLSGVAAVSLSERHVDAQVPQDTVEVMLAIDTSGSMRPAISAAKEAADEFVASMPVEIRIGVETFGDSVTVLTPPTTDRGALSTAINGIHSGGDTALYDAVVTAGQLFAPAVEHKVLVVLSDGKDEGSTATLDDAVAAVQGLHVEAISLTTPQTDIDSLSALGQVTSADDPSGVAAAFARVAGLVVQVVEAVTVPSTLPPTTTAPPPASTIPAPVVVQATPTSAVVVPPVPAVPAVPATTTPVSSTRLYLGGAGIFLGLFVLALMFFPRRRVSKSRLGIDTPRNVSEIGKRTMSAVEEALERRGKRTELATSLAVADISMKPGEFVSMVGVVAIVAGLAGLSIGGPLVGLTTAVTICIAVRLYVRRAKSKRQSALADQLPDVLQLVVTALRSGYGITQALESVAEEAEEPARSEFAQALVEARLGRDLSDSLRAVAQRMECKDLEWVVSAIDINRETGGNLSEILNQVSTTIRERGHIARHVRTLTAEGRLSARILTLLPLVMILWQWKVNPDNFALLLHGAGLIALIVAGTLMVLGGTWVRRIVRSVVL